MSKNTKILLFILIFIISVILIFKKYYFYGLFFVLLSIIPIFFIFRNEFLLLAFFYAAKKDISGLERYLKYIKNPKQQLTKNQMAYYYFLNGILFSVKNISMSEKYMKKSLKLGLKFKDNIVIAKLNIAISYLHKGNKREAKSLLLEVKKINSSEILHKKIQEIIIKMKKINTINRQNPFIRKKL
ncbi:hypothetical protein [Blattabacterium cuenoti]|uniref:hypothetical protein n=1 Tax=Blattabacterium cuenoti TaxID=1653831 RepID=UPI00163BD1E2|nr:hypothetical protein [Blattabacterium cuenoti]